MTKIFVVIPVYNEGKALNTLVDEVGEYKEVSEVVVVDDGSHIPVKKLAGVTVLRHIMNLGKGSAMKTGAIYAYTQGASHVIFMDGDGQHRPGDLRRFFAGIDDGYDIVLGVRRVGPGQPVIRALGNRFASGYINLMFGYRFSDILSGFRSLSHRAFVMTQWDSKRYGVETEMAARFGMYKKELSIKEVRIGTVYKDRYKGVTIMDALSILFETIWWKLTWGYSW